MIPHWVVVVIAFVGPVPADSKFFGPIETQAECEKQREAIVASLHDMGLGVWAECREVKVVAPPEKPKPKGEPGTERNS